MWPLDFIAASRLHSILRCALCAAGLIVSLGCQATGFPDLANYLRSSDDPADEVDQATDADATDDGSRAELARQLQSDTWFTLVRPHAQESGESDPGERFRWQHAGLEQLLQRSPAELGDLESLLASEDRTVAANAAIGLARLGNGAGVEQLVRTVRDVETKLPLRQAAAEALGSGPGATMQPALLTLLCEFGEFQGQRSYVPEIHAELLRSMAFHVDAGSNSHFDEALRSPAPDVRIAALRAWTAGKQGTLPEIVADLLYDPEPQVRIAALQALVARKPDEAEGLVLRALQDHELGVRLAAVAALGHLSSDNARSQLQSLLDDRAELIRVAAVEALAMSGDSASVLGAVADESWRVRAVVADHVGEVADGSAEAVARRLLTDPSAAVQQQTIAALAAWPLERAAPLLLEAIEHGSYIARKDAVARLSAQIPAARDFPIDAPADRRREAFVALEAACTEALGPLGRVRDPLEVASGTSAIPNEEQLRQAALAIEAIRQAVDESAKQQAFDRLRSLNEQLLPVLDALAGDRAVVLPETIYTELLPQHAAAFDLLFALQRGERDERRRAAYRLATEIQANGLSRLALERLTAIVARESDEVVWRSILEALAHDPRSPVALLAYAGLSHPSVDVRVRCCDHLAHHPAPEHATRLIPSLTDDNRLVVLAAVRALGAGPRPPDTSRVHALLVSPQRDLQLEVARTLIRWNDERGRAALERLAFDVDVDVRQHAAELMGELPDASHTPTLIALLDATPSVRRASLTSLQRTAGADHGRGQASESNNAVDQAARWKRWWQQQATAVLPASSPGELR